MTQIKAVLLDIDGTVLNTMEFIYHAFEAAFAESKLLSPSREAIRAQIANGKTLQEVYGFFYPQADLDRLCNAHRADQLNHLELSVPFPNTISTLQKLKAAGLKIAAVSTRSNVTLTKTLEIANLVQYFDAIISGDDVKKCKPDPEALLIILDRFKISPAEAVMVGDTDGDIYAGKNAGTKTIGVTFGFRGEQIAEDKPDFVVHDIAEIVPICLPPTDIPEVPLSPRVTT